MRVLYSFVASLCLLFGFVNAQESNKLVHQDYEQLYMPTIKSIENFKITLSDESIWQATHKEVHPNWLINDRILVRWDDTKLQYFFSKQSNDSLDLNSPKIYVDLLTPPQIVIIAIDAETLTLSDGSTFYHIPFFGTPKVGNRVLVNLNENEQGTYYPYFIVGYDQGDNQNQENWTFTGEVQGRLIQ